MIKLAELVKLNGAFKKDDFLPIDEWEWTEVDYLASMGFAFDGEFHMRLKNPQMTVYKKDEGDESAFYLESPHGKERFATFNDLANFFDNYEQKDSKSF